MSVTRFGLKAALRVDHKYEGTTLFLAIQQTSRFRRQFTDCTYVKLIRNNPLMFVNSS